MDELERLRAAEEIRNLRGRYCIAVDTKNAELLRSLFATDAVADYSGAAAEPGRERSSRRTTIMGPLRGPDAIASSIIKAVTGMVTVHHCTTGDIVVDGDKARATWPMVDRLRLPPGGEFKEVTGYGFYHETYVRQDGAWKIHTLSMSRLRLDETPA